MKATGIVRRIEEYGIIGQKSLKAAQTLVFSLLFVQKISVKTAVLLHI